MDQPPVDQAWLDQQVDEAVLPYVGKLAPADLAWMREQLRERLRTDPSHALLAHRAEPRVVDESGEIFYRGKESSPEPAAQQSGEPSKAAVAKKQAG